LGGDLRQTILGGFMSEEKKTKKLSKSIDGTVLTIVESVTGTTLMFDFNDLPDGIKANLGPYGLSQKLGDAAAGKEGKDAVDAINKVAEGLAKGDWSVRAPASAKITVKDLKEKYLAMEDGAEKSVFKGLLEKLGVKVQ
jgi:hypothetical protein